MHIPITFREKSKKLLRTTNKSPQNVVPKGTGVRASYYMIRRPSSTLSCNKTLIINFLSGYLLAPIRAWRD